jgi:hydroxymethylbilane synthase
VITLRIGTRGSQLALWQARAVAARLEAARDVTCEIVTIKTSGDRLAKVPLGEIGGKRVFVKEIEDALVENVVDLAVHSAKDMASVLPEGLAIAAALPRDDPRDALVLPSSRPAPAPQSLEAIGQWLGDVPRIGTSSVRRIAALHQLWPHASFHPLRGNVDTRLRKLDEGHVDAVVLAAAGLKRLGFESRARVLLPPDVCLPAPGQGVIAVEIVGARADVASRLASLNDRRAAAELDAERALVSTLGGGCQLPLGALARHVDEDTLELSAAVSSLDEARTVRAMAFGPASDAESLGVRVAERLLADGAGRILDDARDLQAPVRDLQP